MSDATILCDAVMRGVILALHDLSKRSDLDACVEIMRDEIKSLISPSHDVAGKYADHREAAMNRSIQDGCVTAAVVLECVERIKALD